MILNICTVYASHFSRSLTFASINLTFKVKTLWNVSSWIVFKIGMTNKFHLNSLKPDASLSSCINFTFCL